VRDLRATDFTLYDNGRPVPVEVFRAPVGDRVPESATALSQPGTETAREPCPPSGRS